MYCYAKQPEKNSLFLNEIIDSFNDKTGGFSNSYRIWSELHCNSD